MHGKCWTFRLGFPATFFWFSVIFAGFSMSGQGQADCLASANEASAEQPAVKADMVQADAPRGWWIVPCVALGAAFWALIISWAFGSG